MRICLATPHPVRSAHGNGVTAARWAGILGELGHTVEVAQQYDDRPADLLLALHARRSADSVRRFHDRVPGRPVVLALTGTDLYPGLDPSDLPVLRLADRLVVLQPGGVRAVPAELRDRVRVIYQSVAAPAGGTPDPDRFDAVLLAHLRPVKDPLLAAAAARLLPEDSRIRISHAGTAMDADLGERAAGESRENPLYRWLGALPREDALSLLAASRLSLLTSRNEGGANATSEAIAAGIPILATRVPGTVGLLGEDYPGYVEPGDPAALDRQLHRAETDAAWYQDLRGRCTALRPLVDPHRERCSWRDLLAELVPA
jgi:putative glycosyltransferase (TIGR04348 family)